MRLKAIVKGLLTFVPVLDRFAMSGTGGTISADYCYAVWLRHLVRASQSGLDTRPKVLAELGPGDSLGTGLAALLSGVERYYAFDAKSYAHSERNLQVFEDLVALFRERSAIPGPDRIPLLEPELDSYEFPGRILDEEHLAAALAPDRLDRIRSDLEDPAAPGADRMIRYFAPWTDARNVEEGSVDAVISHAAMEHVADLEFTYAALMRWMRPGGWMSHQIDFQCHGTADEWNGHWACSDFTWKVVQGRRSYLLNRAPHSTHIEMLERNGFHVVGDFVRHRPSTLARESLPPRFRSLSDEDLTTYSAFVQAVKPADPSARANAGQPT